ncbi:MAG: hypothetical protein LBD42_08015 [Desulfovibrio sp.]|jgi:surface carbohydrate biosynthesis protein|nr:hypothetical protein [Desulfovibrio sp.]
MFCAIPVEIAKRELEGQLYLALHLATLGIPTLLGTKEPVERICLEGHDSFVMLDKGLAFFREDFYRQLTACGGKIVELQAEGLAYVRHDFSLDSCGPLDAIEAYFDALLVWGEKQKPIAQQRLSEKKREQVVVTGHPAFDLLLPEFLPYYHDPAIIKKNGSNFILFNSSFGSRYARISFSKYAAIVNPGSPCYAPEQGPQYQEACRQEERYVQEIKKFAAALYSLNKNRTIVYRPHPVESVALLQEEFKNNPNVAVINDGPVRPWLASAAIVVHKHCTTGLEGLMLGKPVISFQPDDCFNSPAYGLPAASIQELLDHIANIDANGWDEMTRHRLLAGAKPILHNLTGSAASSIARWIHATYLPNGQKTFWRPSRISLARRVRNVLSLAKRIFISRLRPHGKNAVMLQLENFKFPRGTAAPNNILDIITRMRDIQPELTRVSVVAVDKDAVFISPEKTDVS